eukprot:455020_1
MMRLSRKATRTMNILFLVVISMWLLLITSHKYISKYNTNTITFIQPFIASISHKTYTYIHQQNQLTPKSIEYTNTTQYIDTITQHAAGMHSDNSYFSFISCID